MREGDDGAGPSHTGFEEDTPCAEAVADGDTEVRLDWWGLNGVEGEEEGTHMAGMDSSRALQAERQQAEAADMVDSSIVCTLVVEPEQHNQDRTSFRRDRRATDT